MDISQCKYDLTTLRQPIVPESDPELNYDDGLNINYNHIPLFYGFRVFFSGTLLETGDDFMRFTEYRDGKEHGKCLEFDANGCLRVEAFYDDGEMMCSLDWDETGAFDRTTLQQPVLSINDPLLRYADDYAGRIGPLTLYYGDAAFTGTLVEGSPTTAELFTQYENGLMNGEEFYITSEGQCRKITLYRDSEEVEITTWHENGQLYERTQDDGKWTRFWNEHGVLVFQRTVINAESAQVAEYYNSGKLKTFFQTGIPEKRFTTAFSRNGSEIYKEHWAHGSHKKYYEFHHENLLKQYKNLFSCALQADDLFATENERRNFFRGWLGALVKTDHEARTEVLRYFHDFSIYP